METNVGTPSKLMDIVDQGFLKSKQINGKKKRMVKISEFKKWLKPIIRDIIKSQSKK